MINGSCYYFETTKYDHHDAQKNCKKQFKPYKGKLFEPQIPSTNENVYNEAIKIPKIRGWKPDPFLGFNPIS